MTAIDNIPAALTAFPLVDDDAERHRFRVHRSTMTSPEIFREEVKRIFHRSWLYVGHESEVRNPGDYVRRPIAGRPVFMVRGANSKKVHVFHNTCTHRGAVVCRQKVGNSKVFQCFYHAWTFDSEGKLVGVPDRGAYGGQLDLGSLGLKPVARVESYRGFVFASFDENIIDLVTYLAGAREYLDLIIDSAGGEMEIIKGTNEYCIDANWKLLAENSIDGYHALPTHDTCRAESRAHRTILATDTRCWSTPRRGAGPSPSGSRCSASTPARRSPRSGPTSWPSTARNGPRGWPTPTATC
jgi:p-cumate 2,3-dioxygenase alpha subunit